MLRVRTHPLTLSRAKGEEDNRGRRDMPVVLHGMVDIQIAGQFLRNQ